MLCSQEDLPLVYLIQKMVSSKTQSHSSSHAELFVKCCPGGKVGPWCISIALDNSSNLLNIFLHRT